MTTKRKYEKPATKVVQLKHQCGILAGSSQLGVTLDGYGDAEDLTWE